MTRNPNVTTADYIRRHSLSVDQAPDILGAAMQLADVWAVTKPWENVVLTCNEADALADLLLYTGYQSAAADALRKHAADDEPDDLHYGRF